MLIYLYLLNQLQIQRRIHDESADESQSHHCPTDTDAMDVDENEDSVILPDVANVEEMLINLNNSSNPSVCN